MAHPLQATCIHCGDWQPTTFPHLTCPTGPDGKHETIREHLEHDSDYAPGSRYGSRADDWMPVAEAVAVIVWDATGEFHGPDSVDHAASLVVNDHDDPESLIVQHGAEYGFGANALLTHEWHLYDYESEGIELPFVHGDVIIDGAAPRSTVDRIYRLMDAAYGYALSDDDRALVEQCARRDEQASPMVHGDYSHLPVYNSASDTIETLDDMTVSEALTEIERDIRDYIDEHCLPKGCYLDSPDPGDVIVINPRAQALEAIRGHNAYELARMADVSSPDNYTSYGAVFLANVRDAFLDDIEWDEDVDNFSDVVHDLLDPIVPVYNHDRMQTLIDLGAYMESSELAAGGEDIITLAGYVLYQVGERLLFALHAEVEEAE